MTDLAAIAPTFVEIAHRIVWATVATVDAGGRPWTRILHPVWEWDGDGLVGWIASSPTSPKARHLAHQPLVSLTYWDLQHEIATADGAATFVDDADRRRWLWERFETAPPPLGYDPRIIPGWTDPEAPTFGALRVEPSRLRVLTADAARSGTGAVTWRR